MNVAFASLVTVTTVSIFGEGREGTGVLVATGVATAVLLIVGEIVPKAFAVVYAERLALLYARPLQLIETLLLPFVAVLHRIGRVARVGTDPADAQRSITEGELRTLIGIGEAEGELESGEAEMLENVFPLRRQAGPGSHDASNGDRLSGVGGHASRLPDRVR